MTTKIRQITVIACAAVLILTLSITGLLLPDKEMSDSERRKLAQLPDLSISTLLSGSFMSRFEDYTLDQFPARDKLRVFKALSRFYIFRQKDNNGIYIKDGYAAKLEYPLNTGSVDNAASRLTEIYDRYFKNKNIGIYACVVPDKGYYLAKENGYPSMDYDALFSRFYSKLDFATPIDITSTLSIDCYYKTDTHWRQEKITDTARLISSAMKSTLSLSFTEHEATDSFYGVYYGQSALPLKSEKIEYLTSTAIDSCKVYNHETEKTSGVYDFDKLNGKDAYEMFLSGSAALLTLTNSASRSGRKLVVFRDSFGSSLIPLLVSGYSEITVVDTRYIASELIDDYVSLDCDDVLFIYSTLILNDSYTLK